MAYTQTISATGWSARSEAIMDLGNIIGPAMTDEESNVYKAAFDEMMKDPRACAEDCIYAAHMALGRFKGII